MCGCRTPLVVLPVALALACGSARQFDRSTEPGAGAVPVSVEVQVLTAEDLSFNPGWTVLDALRNRVPGTKIRELRGTQCPAVELRGRDTMEGESNPIVYVDGTRTNDTCTLTSLQAAVVRRIEIYPLGYTPRPGYAGGAHGLILIFLKRAEETDTTNESPPGA